LRIGLLENTRAQRSGATLMEGQASTARPRDDKAVNAALSRSNYFRHNAVGEIQISLWIAPDLLPSLGRNRFCSMIWLAPARRDHLCGHHANRRLRKPRTNLLALLCSLYPKLPSNVLIVRVLLYRRWWRRQRLGTSREQEA
jgi:hypothetical protein